MEISALCPKHSYRQDSFITTKLAYSSNSKHVQVDSIMIKIDIGSFRSIPCSLQSVEGGDLEFDEISIQFTKMLTESLLHQTLSALMNTLNYSHSAYRVTWTVDNSSESLYKAMIASDIAAFASKHGDSFYFIIAVDRAKAVATQVLVSKGIQDTMWLLVCLKQRVVKNPALTYKDDIVAPVVKGEQEIINSSLSKPISDSVSSTELSSKMSKGGAPSPRSQFELLNKLKASIDKSNNSIGKQIHVTLEAAADGEVNVNGKDPKDKSWVSDVPESRGSSTKETTSQKPTLPYQLPRAPDNDTMIAPRGAPHSSGAKKWPHQQAASRKFDSDDEDDVFISNYSRLHHQPVPVVENDSRGTDYSSTTTWEFGKDAVPSKKVEMPSENIVGTTIDVNKKTGVHLPDWPTVASVTPSESDRSSHKSKKSSTSDSQRKLEVGKKIEDERKKPAKSDVSRQGDSSALDWPEVPISELKRGRSDGSIGKSSAFRDQKGIKSSQYVKKSSTNFDSVDKYKPSTSASKAKGPDYAYSDGEEPEGDYYARTVQMESNQDPSRGRGISPTPSSSRSRSPTEHCKFFKSEEGCRFGVYCKYKHF